ncbi:hypothetical protein EDD86DRAFT_88054 [Gorgonomyces haynaldii]|nr:hypothetical protein EDD86DRAFT_88054 [Gorgonomyces haynaldii]
MFVASLIATTNAAAVGGNLLQNGNFDDAADLYCKQAWCGLPNNATNAKAIAPWYFVSGVDGGFEVDSSPSPWQAHSGKWSMDLSWNNPYTIAQDVTLTPGTKYQIFFALNQNSCNGGSAGPMNKTMFVSATGGKEVTYSYYNGGVAGGQWKDQAYYFTASQAKTTIKVGGSSPGSCGAVVDSFVLQPVTKKCAA